MSIRIEQDVFYTREELISIFKSVGVDWDSLCNRIKPRKVTKLIFLGSDILSSWRQYQGEEGEIQPVSSYSTKRKRSGTTPTGAIFDRLIEGVKRNG